MKTVKKRRKEKKDRKKKEKEKWRIWVSIPVPPACKAGALPSELIPHMLQLGTMNRFDSRTHANVRRVKQCDEF